MSKNLVFLIPELRHGGAERVVSNLSYLLQNDFNIKIVVFDDSVITYNYVGELVSLEVPFTNKPIKKIFNLFKLIYRYNNFKKNNTVDVTYSFGDTANLINVITKKGDTKIISIRGFKSLIKGNNFIERAFIKPVLKKVLELADKVIVVSKLIQETIIEEYNITPKKVHTSYNGYDLENIQKLSLEKLTDAEEVIFRKPVIITAGTFRYEKGYWHLLKSFKTVVDKNKEIQLVILGNDYRNYKKKIVKLSKDLKIENNIHFLAYSDNPFKYFYNSQVYALSSVFEGFPNALMEAMACGVPIVANDCQSGPKEILAPYLSTNYLVKQPEYSEFGILTPRFEKNENFDSTDIDSKHVDYGNCLVYLVENRIVNKDYSIKSQERVKDFSFEQWSKRQVQIIEI